MTTCPAEHIPGLWHPDGRCAWITAPDAADMRCPDRATRLHGPLHLCERHRRVADGLDVYLEIHRELFEGVRNWHSGRLGDADLHALVIADERAIRIAMPHLVAQDEARAAAARTLAGREVDMLAAASVKQVQSDRSKAMTTQRSQSFLGSRGRASAVADVPAEAPGPDLEPAVPDEEPVPHEEPVPDDTGDTR